MSVSGVGCKFDVDRGPDWLIVKIWALDADPLDPPPLASQFWALAERHFTYRLVLEMDQIKVLNSSLIGQLIQLYKLLSEHDGVLRLCGLSPANRRILHRSALEGHFPAYGTREEAVLGGADPRLPR
jgi:anti-anti-sigma factor